MPNTVFIIGLPSKSKCAKLPGIERFSNERGRAAVFIKWNGVAERPWRAICTTLFLILALSSPCFSSEVVLFRAGASPSSEQRQLELATQFYGLDLKIVTVSSNHVPPALEAIRLSTCVAVAIEADALADVDQKVFLRTLRRGQMGGVPLLILGVTPETDPAILGKWSDLRAIEARSLDSRSSLQYVVGDKSEISRQLTGLDFPYPGGDAFYFHLGERSKAREILSVRDDHQVVPVFIEEYLPGQEIFLLCKAKASSGDNADEAFDSTERQFERIAAVMMFTKYCAGERGWHALHHYANLTVDDPWLREPYGNLSYEGLFKEMERHNFHTTIAFIPWNYDRSKGDVVSLFRRHPDRFSICIHGDDHAHKEFTDYASKPLETQIDALRQSVARMEAFREKTGIPYDKVMVFPHSIAPEKTLEALRDDDYLATINSQNVPMGAARPREPLFAMRPITLSFGGFPSVRRYAVANPNPGYRLAINDFLDNPLFFYAHQDFFAKGIDAFDALADQVNRLEPETDWNGVGDIMRHQYVLKLRDDSNYDVLSFTNSILLDNASTRDAIFYVEKQEYDAPTSPTVTVNGKQIAFQLNGRYLRMQVAIPAGVTRSISIQYGRPHDLIPVSISKSSLYVYLLREASDFRDITLSRLFVGRALTDFYYRHGMTPKLMVLIGCGVMVLCIVGVWCLFVAARRNKVISRFHGISPRPIR